MSESKEFKKSDAIDYAHAIKLLVDALIDEGFDPDIAESHVFTIMEAKAGKRTTLF